MEKRTKMSITETEHNRVFKMNSCDSLVERFKIFKSSDSDDLHVSSVNAYFVINNPENPKDTQRHAEFISKLCFPELLIPKPPEEESITTIHDEPNLSITRQIVVVDAKMLFVDYFGSRKQ